jgi:predicted hydrocarbon binding protein
MNSRSLTNGGEAIGEEEVAQEVSNCSKLLKDGKAFIMRVVTFTDFKKVLEERFASGAFTIFYELGLGCGRRSCQRLMQKYPDRVRLLKAIARYKRNERWGKIKFELDPEKGTGKVFVTESFEAKQYGPSQHPICYFFKGYLEGALSQAFNKPLRASEIECIAKGDKQCVFQIEMKS